MERKSELKEMNRKRKKGNDRKRKGRKEVDQ